MSAFVVLCGMANQPALGQLPTGTRGATVAPYVPRPTSVRRTAHLMAEPAIVYEEATTGCDSCEGGSSIACSTSDCGNGASCCVWGNVEYLLWFEQDTTFPPLVTTSPNGTPRDNAGVLGLNSTSVLFGGNQAIESGQLSGVRLTLGFWLDDCQGTSIAARAFGIQDHGATYFAASNGDQILGRPFFNAFTQEQDALLLGFPNEIRGDVQVTQDSQTQGAQVFFRQLYHSGCNYRWDVVYGYRYLGVDESLTITDSLEFIDPTGNTFGNTISQLDQFDVQNEFHGGELGLMGHSTDGRWSLDFLTTIALGSMRQTATVRGNTTATQQGLNPVTLQGGLLTQDSNIGTYKDDPFTVIPEFNVTLGYMITPRLDFTIGYTFLYVNHVSRPGQLIDTDVNLTQQTGNLEGPAVPAFTFQDSDYWLQGVNFGLSLRY